MLKYRMNKGFRYVMIFIVIVISILLFGQYINDFVGTIGLVASVMIVIYQLSCENDVTLGSFILELNSSFTENEKIQDIYTKLKDFEGDTSAKDLINESDRKNLDEYLVFFETISVLNKKRVVNMSILDEMFGYRFFIAMNNPSVQQVEILSTGLQHYTALIELYIQWRTYRIKKDGKESIPLEASHSFYEVLKKENYKVK